MQDYEQHQRRLSAALLRIGAVCERLSEPPPAAQVLEAARGGEDSAGDVEIARLKRRLADVEAHSAEVEARNAILEARHSETVGSLDSRLAALNGQIEAQGAEMQRMRMINVQLREALRALREGMAGGVADAAAINTALLAEIEALRGARELEVSELDALLTALDPLIAKAASGSDL